MGQLLVRNLDDEVIERLKAKALDRGTSLEQFVRESLSEVAGRADRAAWLARLDMLRARIGPVPGWDSAHDIRAAREELDARLAPMPSAGTAGG